MLRQGRQIIGKLRRITGNEKGQGLVEYALILVLIAIVVLAALQGIGVTTNNSFSSVNNALQP